MSKRLLALFLVLLALGAAYHFRADIVVGAYNTLSPDDGWKAVALEGVWARPGAAGADRLVMEDAVTGRRIEILDLRAEQPFSSVLGQPVAQLSARRLQLGPAARSAATAPPELALQAWMERLRAPLFTELRVESLVLPLWPLALSLRAGWGGGALELELAGGPWRAAGVLRSEEAGRADARFALFREEHEQARVDLALARQADGHRLEASGRVDVPRSDSLPMPLRTYADVIAGGLVDWRASVRIPEDPRALMPTDIEVIVGEGSVLHFGAGVLEGLRGPDIAIAAPLALSFAGTFGPDLEILAREARLRVDGLDYGGFGLDAVLNVPGARYRGGPQPAAQLEMSLSEVRAHGVPGWLPAPDTDVLLSLTREEWSFQCTLRLSGGDDAGPLHINGAWHPRRGGQATATLARQAFSVASPLSARFAGWPFVFDLAGGELEAEVLLSLAPAGQSGGILSGARLSGNMRELTGYHGEVFFQGLSGPLRGEFSPNADFPFSTPRLAWALERFNAGIDFTSLALDFQLTAAPPALVVNGFSAGLLGGTLHSDGFVYGFGSGRNVVELAFQDVRLERVLDLVDQEGVEAAGGVSGVLPIVVENGVASVEAGSFRSEEPGGLIRYMPARQQGAAVNPGLSLVEQALSDYRFENIDGTLDYTPQGDIDISLRIQGYNPQMNDGQRINLNLTLSDNLPVLLRSLQAGRTIQDMLEEQL